MTTRITGQLGTSASLLGEFELGAYDGDATVAAQSAVLFSSLLGLEYITSVSSSLSFEQVVNAQGGSQASDGGGWKRFPVTMNVRWGLGLLR